MTNVRKASTAAFVGLLAAGLLTGAFAAGAPERAGGRVYANGELWATFGTADFKMAPAPSVDKIYVFPGTSLTPVGEASPGDSDYNGGRWEVHEVSFADGVSPVQFTSDEQVMEAAAAGDVSIGGVVKYFQCPLFHM